MRGVRCKSFSKEESEVKIEVNYVMRGVKWHVDRLYVRHQESAKRACGDVKDVSEPCE